MLGLENDGNEFIESILAQLAPTHVQLLQSLCSSVNTGKLLYSIPTSKSFVRG